MWDYEAQIYCLQKVIWGQYICTHYIKHIDFNSYVDLLCFLQSFSDYNQLNIYNVLSISYWLWAPWNDWISFRNRKPSGVSGYHIKTYTYWAMNVTDNLSSYVDIGSNLSVERWRCKRHVWPSLWIKHHQSTQQWF